MTERFLDVLERELEGLSISMRRTAALDRVAVQTRNGWEEIDLIDPPVPPPPAAAWRCGYCAGLQPATSYRCGGCGAAR